MQRQLRELERHEMYEVSYLFLTTVIAPALHWQVDDAETSFLTGLAVDKKGSVWV